MKKFFLAFFAIFFFLLFAISYKPIFAQSPAPQFNPPEQKYYKAEVTKIERSGTRDIQNYKNFFQFVEVKILEGSKMGKTIGVENSGSIKIAKQKELKVGDKIVLLEVIQDGQIQTKLYLLSRHWIFCISNYLCWA
jgi:uncharacterized membrane protein